MVNNHCDGGTQKINAENFHCDFCHKDQGGDGSNPSNSLQKAKHSPQQLQRGRFIPVHIFISFRSRDQKKNNKKFLAWSTRLLNIFGMTVKMQNGPLRAFGRDHKILLSSNSQRCAGEV
jgi:hypothetical protein